MFNLMKSKKGFTLVELMIVVVIMAILVAVAVPIFSAVTANARAKTCIGNQREIISSVGNWLMLQSDTDIAGTFTTSGGQDDPEMVFPNDTTLDTDAIEGLFKTVPVCPDAANTITVTISADDTGTGKATVATECNNSDADHPHVVPGTAEADDAGDGE